MIKRLLSIFVLVSIFIFFGCPLFPEDTTTENCNGNSFDFTMPIIFNSSDKIVQIGDTLTIKCEFPSVMWDDAHQEQLYFDDINFFMGGNIYRLDTTVQGQYEFLELFDIIVDSVYNFQKNFSAFAFDFQYLQDKYDFVLKLVPRHRGIFEFRIHSFYELNYNKYTPPFVTGYNSDCNTNNWFVLFRTNGGNTHSNLIDELENEELRDWYKDNWGRIEKFEGGYLFKVE
jgi:hypothetical protein